MLVGSLEQALFDAFPRSDAEDWDHVGLSVGDPDSEVGSVYVALDATVETVRATRARGANVLLTHHPVYISAPDAFVPRAGAHPQASAAVFEAARLGVSVLSFHTNLDRSRAAQRELPARLGLSASCSLEHPEEPEARGLGSIADLLETTLFELARDAADAFATEPRVWGAPNSPVTRCAFLGGSLGGLGEAAIANGAQAVVTGEAGYHVCQDLALRGLGVILLGHDMSEYPFTDILVRAACRAGVDPARILRTDPPSQWWTVAERSRA